MRFSFIIIIFLFSSLYNLMANDLISDPVKSLNKTVKNILPFKLFKEAAKKVTTIGPKQLLFGASAAAIISEGVYKEGDKKINTVNSINSDAVNHIQIIRAKGQINLNGIDENEAKRRALEDALYYASMKAGADIDGFSSIDEQTSLNESFIVKPTNKILDYKIISSYKEEGNYIVEIEAVTGEPNNISHACVERKIINIKEFRGKQIISTNTPSWGNEYIEKLLYNIRRGLKKESNIVYTNFSSKVFDFNRDNFDKSFDYNTLVNGSINLTHGDFIYIPSFIIKESKIKPSFYIKKYNSNTNEDLTKNYNLLDADAISILSKVDIYDAIKNTLVTSIEKEYLIPINVDSNIEIIELFTKNDQKFFEERLHKISDNLLDLIKKELSCRPVIAKMQLIDNKLRVPIGSKQGLRKNQLAVLDNSEYKWTMLSISSVNTNSAVLSPLNSKIKVKELAGKETRFLE